jgi:hypothetical protein
MDLSRGLGDVYKRQVWNGAPLSSTQTQPAVYAAKAS